MPLRDHRLSWDQRKTLHDHLVRRASLLRVARADSNAAAGSAELDEIDAALHRLDTAAYGACVDCGAPIAWDRLLARPQVQRCTRCQSAADPAETASPRPGSV